MSDMDVRLKREDDWIGSSCVGFERTDFEAGDHLYEVHGYVEYTETHESDPNLDTPVVEPTLVIEAVYRLDTEDCRELSPEEALAFGRTHASALTELHGDDMANAAEEVAGC